MEAICGIIGKRDVSALDAMVRALRPRADASHRAVGDAYAVAASHPFSAALCLLDGAPLDQAGNALASDAFHQMCLQAGRPDKVTIRGAFAAAVGLDNGKRWWFGRDTLGRKPLYYYPGHGFLLFASEIKALLASSLVPKRLNLLAVDRYLTLRCVPGPESIIAGVYRVQPGHIVDYSDNRVMETRVARHTVETHEQSREAAAKRLKALLADAVNAEEASDLLWSSGIDAAALAALQPDLKPVFVNLERGWQDEARLAKESARLMHKTLRTTPARPLTTETVHRAVRALDEPIADPGVIPLWLVAEASAEHGKRFICGHGADELLGGYPRFNFLQKARGAKKLVPAGLLTDLMPALPPNAFIRRGSRYLVSMHDVQESYLSLVSVFDRGEREDLYTDAMKSSVYDLGAGIPVVQEHFTDSDMTRNVLALDLNVGIPNLLLHKCDRIAAAHGLDLRFPYLSDEFVRFATTLPAKAKFGVRSKPLLRLAMRGTLPAAVRMRVRRDFRIPQGGRALRVIESVAAECITPDRIDATGLFRWNAVNAIVRESTHNVYRRRQFWALVMFFAWYRNVMEA